MDLFKNWEIAREGRSDGHILGIVNGSQMIADLADVQNAEAIVRLLVDAPDLLQALTELTQSASEFLAQVPRSVAAKNAEILRADIDKAKDVIARAKGGTL